MSESDDEVSDPDSAVVFDGEMPILSIESDAPSSSVLLEALSFYTDTVPVSHVPQTGLSLADKALGRTESTLIQSSVSDSPLIARDLATARRRFLTPSLADDFGQVVDAASEVAQLTQPAPALAPAPRRLPIRGSRWLCSAFPSPGTGLMVTEADRDKLGLSSRTSSDVLVSDSALRLFETSAEKGLMTAGRMDSVLAALTSALSGGDPSRDPDPEREHFMIQALLGALADGTMFLADILATQHLNAVLLRRDRLLAQSVLPSAARAATRSLPVVSPFLFGSETGRVVQEASSHASNTRKSSLV